MKKIFRFLGIVIAVLIVVYLIGPKPPKPEYSKDIPSVSASISLVEKYIENKNAELEIKPDNETRIFWANDSVKERTDYSVLYLHGFSASWYEGYPAHVTFAKKFGCNLYIPLLASHGLVTDEPLIDMTPDALYESAKEALMIARSIGKKVILMSSSTGGTLSLKLAAEFPEYVDALIMYSPNIEINNGAAFLLSKQWGLQLGRKVNKGKYRITNEDFESKDCMYWYCKYRMEGTVFLQQLVETTMTPEVFQNVTAPVFMGYYYKDEDNQDPTVKVDAMLKMYDQLGTSGDRKRKVAFADAGAHVIGCELTSGCVDEVIAETVNFGMEVLQLKAVN